MNGPSIRETEWTYFSAHTLDTIVKLSNRLPLFADILISLTMATQAAWWSRFFLSRHGLSVSHGLSRWSRTVWKTSHPFITIYIYICICTSSVFILDEFRPERSRAKLIKRQLIDSRERCGARLWLKIVNSNDRSTGGLIFYRESRNDRLRKRASWKVPCWNATGEDGTRKCEDREPGLNEINERLFFFLSFVAFVHV